MKTRLNGRSPRKMDNSVLTKSTAWDQESPLEARKLPGLYMIHCLANDYRYYGESDNVSGRIASHKSMLRRKIHPNMVLQSDWNRFAEDSFKFVVLYLGEDWAARKARLEMESGLILKDVERVYNCFDSFETGTGERNPFYKRRHSEKTKALQSLAKKGIPNDLLGKKISIDGQRFPSVAEAGRALGHARKTIRIRLNSPEYPDWFTIVDDHSSLTE
ncbi:hypothetical protein COCOBI_pt-2100 (chloroplast) [Coccomyxa sp. Obi]|nr:hypothetical protein COCOBI_pt-2100 [Coccomyxa sp. Obi]